MRFFDRRTNHNNILLISQDEEIIVRELHMIYDETILRDHMAAQVCPLPPCMITYA